MEKDRHGTDQHALGAKLDHGKTRLDLVLGDFANALEAVGQIGTFGAEKYTDHGWLYVPGAKERYSDALLRHWRKSKTGEPTDTDSGMSHAAHLAWNALAVLELELRDGAYEQENSAVTESSSSEDSGTRGGYPSGQREHHSLDSELQSYEAGVQQAIFGRKRHLATANEDLS